MPTTAYEKLIAVLLDGPSYGLEIQGKLKQRGTPMGPEVYYLLRKMEKEGLVTTESKDENLETRNGRPRIYYTLTETGKGTLLHD